jgi:hypothetical protein
MAHCLTNREQVSLVLQMVICPLTHLLKDSECYDLETIPDTGKKAKPQRRFVTCYDQQAVKEGVNLLGP